MILKQSKHPNQKCSRSLLKGVLLFLLGCILLFPSLSTNISGSPIRFTFWKTSVSQVEDEHDTVEDKIYMLVREIHDKMMIVNASIQAYNISCNEKSVDGTEDLLCMRPPKFLPEHKNPCWYSQNKFRCLPYFHLIGGPKCASSDYFDRIIAHPDAIGNGGIRKKETFWYSWRRYGYRGRTLRRSRKENFQDLLRYFQTSSEMILKHPERNIITGDGTPVDLSDNTGWPSIPQNNGLHEPKFTTAHLIRHLTPEAKLLVILRDPVERLYSDFYFVGAGNLSKEGFHKAVVDAIEILHACTRNSSLRTCLYNRTLHQKLPVRLHMGFYFIFIQDWFQVFPREQFQIIRTEDYSKNMAETLQQTFRFLGLRDLPPSDVNKICETQRRFVTKRKAKAENMKSETRRIVQELYSKFNQQLARLLNDNRYTWQ